MTRLHVAILTLALCWPVAASAAPPKMTRDDIVKLSKTVVGFSYWWGGSKWKPGSSSKGSCKPNAGSSGCPKCSHSGTYGADCSGFVGKAWQVAVAKPLDVAYHPYATTHFTNNTTWWNKIARSQTEIADAFTYNKNGAGHIFMYEKGDPWGKVWAWECKGCKYGCVYSLRSASSYYGVRQRKLLVAPPPVCTAHCSGATMVDAQCKKTDCSKSAAKCVNDSLGLRCASVYCAPKGSAKVCLPNGGLGSCSNGKLSSSKCSDGKKCVKLSATNATCVPPCPASCNDNNPCTKDGCTISTGKCSHNALSGTSCWDGNKCLSGQKCSKGKCGGGKAAKNCDDSNPCTKDACTAATGACTHTGTAGSCDDGNKCTVGDSCKAGACKAGAVKACDDGNECTDDTCKAGACSHNDNAAKCDDGHDCTLADTCAASACAGKPMQCDDGLACTQDMCREGACKHPEIEAEPTADCRHGNVVLLSPCGKVVKNHGPCPAGESCSLGKCVVQPVGADAGGADTGARPVGNDGLSGQDGGNGTRMVAPQGVAPSAGCSAGSSSPVAGWLLGLVALGLIGWRRRRERPSC